ncbi:MAG: nuclear transport factor 2 family protein [Pseudomonadota bacterium]
MSLKEIAMRLVDANKSGKIDELIANDYAEDIVSVEAVAFNPELGAEVKGIEALRGKYAWWEQNMEMHSVGMEGPFIHGDDRFSVIFEADMTDKKSGERTQSKEVAVYYVKNGKIVREEFYFDAAAF